MGSGSYLKMEFGLFCFYFKGNLKSNPAIFGGKPQLVVGSVEVGLPSMLFPNHIEDRCEDGKARRQASTRAHFVSGLESRIAGARDKAIRCRKQRHAANQMDS